MELINWIVPLIKSIRVPDILDMAIIAVMIFALLMWFKTRASRYVLVGIFFLGVIYLAARFFQLYLTVIVLQGFFAILLFVLVVIFQEDLRGFFERLAMLGNLRRQPRPLSQLEKTARVIAEASLNLAKKRVGALIVMQGNDPLDRHLTGGVDLQGKISAPLLESLFDPHSPGHDGAAIIKDDRLVQFGCHLPLANDVSRYGNIGLRHTAALGLAERSDAFCVAVSEERGTISVAQAGALSVLPSPAALNDALEKFFIATQPAPVKGRFPEWIRKNSKEKVIAIALACILWVAFGYQREIVRRDFTLPIEYKNIPVDWRIDDPQVTEAKVVFQGPGQAFQLMDERALKISVDLGDIARKKREFPLTKSMVNAPSNITVTDIIPSKIRVYPFRQVPAKLKVAAVTINSPPKHLRLHSLDVTPDRLPVMIDSRMKPSEIQLETETIDLSMVSSSMTIEKRIVPTQGVAFPEGRPPAVVIDIDVRRR
ncbi:MAG TPA: diadenylate cyclase [Smithellaceae bacterium]|nr:diadenylate cyclase [Smithellaceae bacterium]